MSNPTEGEWPMTAKRYAEVLSEIEERVVSLPIDDTLSDDQATALAVAHLAMPMLAALNWLLGSRGNNDQDEQNSWANARKVFDTVRATLDGPDEEALRG